jgi:hypothetical protein
MTDERQRHRRRVNNFYGLLLGLIGVFLAYETTSYGDMLYAEQNLTFLRHPLVALFFAICELGGIFYVIGALGLAAIYPCAMLSLLAAVFLLWPNLRKSD